MDILSSYTFWVLTILLLCVAFLMQLNGYLRGRLKPIIDAVLGSGWVLLLILSFIFLGWKIGLVHIVVSFVFGAIIQPLASSVASRMMSRI